MRIYKPPKLKNLYKFFKEVSEKKIAYENFLIMGDFDIDIITAGMEVDKLDEFCNLSDLTNLTETETCCTKNHKSVIDLFLTNRHPSFQKPRATETGISDYHDLISTCFKYFYTLLKPKIIYCKNYNNNFTKEIFLKDPENLNLSENSEHPHENYNNLLQTFSKVVKKHSPLTKNILRRNHAPLRT